MLGGDVTLETEFGQGSTFSVSIDCGETKKSLLSYEEYCKSDEAADSSPSIPALTGQVLVAEDNEVNQRLITMYIKSTAPTWRSPKMVKPQ